MGGYRKRCNFSFRLFFFFFLELFSSSASLEVQQKTIKTFGTVFAMREVVVPSSIIIGKWGISKGFSRFYVQIGRTGEMINEHVM